MLETRIRRPHFAAAPGRGAAPAAFDIAWVGEGAVAGGGSAACVVADLQAFYGHVEVSDFAGGARGQGITLTTTSVCAHLYPGPRRIRMGRAISAEAHPRRSALPGWTWATVHVRLLMLNPGKKFLEALGWRLRPHAVHLNLTIYIDGLTLMVRGGTTGSSDAFVLGWPPSSFILGQCLAETRAKAKATMHSFRGVIPGNRAEIDGKYRL